MAERPDRDLTSDPLDRGLAAALGFPPEKVAIAHQVHGAELIVHAGPQVPSPFVSPDSAIPQVDGHVTAEPALPLLVLVADCVPVALFIPSDPARATNTAATA